MSVKQKRTELQALNRTKYTKIIKDGHCGELKIDIRAIDYDKQFGWFKCEHCGKIFMRAMATTRVSNKLFCSKQCRVMSGCIKRNCDKEKFNLLFKKWNNWINKKVLYFHYEHNSFIDDIIQECYITLFRCCSINKLSNSYIAKAIYHTIKSAYSDIIKEYKNISFEEELYNNITYQNNEELMDIIKELKNILTSSKLPISVMAGIDYCAGYTINEIAKKYNLTKDTAEKKRYTMTKILRKRYPETIKYLQSI